MVSAGGRWRPIRWAHGRIVRRFDRLSGGAGDARISVQSARGLNEEARCVRHAPQNFRKIFHDSNYLNDQINFGVGA